MTDFLLSTVLTANSLASTLMLIFIIFMRDCEEKRKGLRVGKLVLLAFHFVVAWRKMVKGRNNKTREEAGPGSPRECQ